MVAIATTATAGEIIPTGHGGGFHGGWGGDRNGWHSDRGWGGWGRYWPWRWHR
jgi:hypothetical protein